MTFKTTVDVLGVIIGATIGAATILVISWLFGDFEHDDVTLAFGFVMGQLTRLWIEHGNRDRESKS